MHSIIEYSSSFNGLLLFIMSTTAFIKFVAGSPDLLGWGEMPHSVTENL